MVIVDFWRNQNNQKGLTPANGISPNFISLQKFYRTAIIMSYLTFMVMSRPVPILESYFTITL